jgi:hypothetical protein
MFVSGAVTAVLSGLTLTRTVQAILEARSVLSAILSSSNLEVLAAMPWA